MGEVERRGGRIIVTRMGFLVCMDGWLFIKVAVDNFFQFRAFRTKAFGSHGVDADDYSLSSTFSLPYPPLAFPHLWP